MRTGVRSAVVAIAVLAASVPGALAATPTVPFARALGLLAAAQTPVSPSLQSGGAAAGPTGVSDVVLRRETTEAGSFAAIADHAEASDGPIRRAEASSAIEDLDLLGGLVTARALHARVRAEIDTKTGAGFALDAGSTVAELSVGGTPVTVTAPNKIVEFPGGHAAILETIVGDVAGRREITVNLVHVFVDHPAWHGEIVVGSAYAGVAVPGVALAGPDTRFDLDDDAGSGGDAGDSIETATSIRPPASYAAGFRPGADVSDFYAFAAGPGNRIVATLQSAAFVHARPPAGSGMLDAGDPPDVDLLLYDPLRALRETTQWTVSGAAQRVEINADHPGAWVLEARRRPFERAGTYQLSVGIMPLRLWRDDGDVADVGTAATAGDAPSACPDARALPQILPGVFDVAFTGSLGAGDPSDAFALASGATVRLKPDESLDGADFDVYLYEVTPGGSCLPQASSTNREPGAKAQPEEIWIPTHLRDPVIEIRRVSGIGNYLALVTYSA